MSPITVEMILFLKKNKDLCGIKNIARANQSWLKADRSERVERKIAEHEEFMKDMEALGVGVYRVWSGLCDLRTDHTLPRY